MTTNPDVLRLARIIANETVPEDSEGANHKSEWYIARDAAIAAIERTTFLGASYLNVKHGLPTHDYEPGYSDIQDLRRYDHLRQPEKGSTDE